MHCRYVYVYKAMHRYNRLFYGYGTVNMRSCISLIHFCYLSEDDFYTMCYTCAEIFNRIKDSNKSTHRCGKRTGLG